MEAEAPLRGPVIYEDFAYTYRCSTKGDYDWFHVHETIEFQGQIVYECHDHGGTVK
ncbi:MAG: DUF5680 domain-containing protein [Bacillota bacterium]|nr:DUF5680 domain-containing protein [Bacillota bacterium]